MGRRMDAAEYRAKARELREIAESMHDPVARAQVLVIADQYDQLAEWAEARGRESKKR
jgi:hypothetical protein